VKPWVAGDLSATVGMTQFRAVVMPVAALFYGDPGPARIARNIALSLRETLQQPALCFPLNC
jgi:hypothetical protein